MPNDVPESLSREQRLDEAVTAFLEAQEAGRQPLRQEWLDRFPEVAAGLEQFFADQDEVDRLTGPLRAAFQGTPPPGDTPQPGQPDSTSSPLSPSALAAAPEGYELLKVLGQGGMGLVYKARQKNAGRLVALKLIRAERPTSESDVQRFRNEAEAGAQLDHPHIVPVYEVGSRQGHFFFSMKLIEGGGLDEQLARFRDDAPGAARLVVQVARAVHHAHQRGILHRDLKPSNILLDREGQPHVSDFGLAKRVEADASLTQTGAIVGTPQYMAPEQTSGRKGAVTTTTDVYGLGAVLYALLTGRPPFRGETVLETLERVREREPEPPRHGNPKVDRDLETICLKCLQKEPQPRYESAQAVAEDLERWLTGEPIRARRISFWRRIGKWIRRRPALAVAVAVLGMGLAVLAGGIGWVARDRAAQRAAISQQVTEALEQSALRQQERRLPEALSAARRANELLAGADVDETVLQRVRARLKDLVFWDRLEKARLEIMSSGKTKDGHFDWEEADALFGQAFREAGLDVEALSIEKAGEQLRSSTVAIDVAAVLDEWARIRRNKGADDPSWKALFRVARSADPDSGRTRLRIALERRDQGALRELAASEEVFRFPVATLSVLASALLNDEEARVQTEAFLREAQRRHPNDFRLNSSLYGFFRTTQPSQHEDAIRFATANVALLPENAAAHTMLGTALADKGRLDEAIAEYREAIHLNQDNPLTHINLGLAFQNKGQLDEAIGEYREAVRLNKDFAGAHDSLGSALAEKGQPDEAIAEFREAIRLRKDLASAHSNLGGVLFDIGRLDEAITECREAIRIQKDYSGAHVNLGGALLSKGRLDEAIVEFKEAIRLKKAYPGAYSDLKKSGIVHYNLGLALQGKGRPDEAIAEYKEAIRLKKDLAEAHCNLAEMLKQKGQFAESLKYLRRGHELGSRNPRWPYPSAQWLRDAERLLELDGKLSAVLSGQKQPTDSAERLALAQFCQTPSKQCCAAAVRFYSEAFADKPQLADDLNAQHRYNAACAAALAGCGQGKDADKLDEKERFHWRQQALDWLRADLQAYRQLLEKSAGKAGPAIAQRMQHWLQDPDFAGVRAPGLVAVSVPADTMVRVLDWWSVGCRIAASW